MGIKVGIAVQSGRQALLRKVPAQALVHFQAAARQNPSYVYRSAHFSEGVWTYVGRCQYAVGDFSAAQQSLELALTKEPDDLLARLYLGLTLMRSGHDRRGAMELRSGLQQLHDWIEDILNSRSAEAYWDPNKQLRSAIEQTVLLLSDPKGDRQSVMTNAEWIGGAFEEEIDRVRRDESRQID
jgi:tetratricopeptide (TPR) repeat protein